MTDKTNKTVVVVDSDDASPEAMIPSVNLIERMGLPIEFIRPPVGDVALAETGSALPEQTRKAIDTADATWFEPRNHRRILLPNDKQSAGA